MNSHLESLKPVLLPRSPDRVAIAMCGQGWSALPTNQSDLNIWATNAFINNAYHSCMDFLINVWFEIHNREMFSQPKAWFPASHPSGTWLKWLAETRKPVVMQQHHPEFPTSLPFPMDLFGDGPVEGTLDYMIVLATALGVKRLELYGCNYASAHEFYYQRAGALYWIGYARGKGVDVWIGHDALLLKPVLPGRYGWEYPPWPDKHHPNRDRWETLEPTLPLPVLGGESLNENPEAWDEER